MRSQPRLTIPMHFAHKSRVTFVLCAAIAHHVFVCVRCLHSADTGQQLAIASASHLHDPAMQTFGSCTGLGVNESIF